MLKKANLLLLAISSIIPSILVSIPNNSLPPMMHESLECQFWGMRLSLPFAALLLACFYLIAGCFIGIKVKGYKDAIIKPICVGLGLFFGILPYIYFYNDGFFPIEQILSSFLMSWLFVVIVATPAIIMRFLCSRVKLNRYFLFTITSTIVIIAYVLLFSFYTEIDKNDPLPDVAYGTTDYTGVKQQIVKDSQFQLERDLTPGREDYYSGYGSFPAIGFCNESYTMLSEFCHQHLTLQRPNEQYFIMKNEDRFRFDSTLDSLINKSNIPIYIDRFKDLHNKRPVDIAFILGKPEESYENIEGKAIEIASSPIALDALVFIVHKDNPVDNLSTEQLHDIYAGKIKNWQKLGGDNKAIRNYQRHSESYTYSIMEEMVMQGTPLVTPEQAEPISLSLSAAYQNYPESIGYCLLSFYKNDGFSLGSEAKMLSINGVYPNEANIRDGSYTYNIKFYAAIRKGEEDDSGGRFLEWILSDEGQACILQSGYLPLR
ncbi:MAG: substrate-binding domain-containing protein [Synergistaceae bacterium]|nr:substrate-binding domain-containing protein [Synergistaceae bacterium]